MPFTVKQVQNGWKIFKEDTQSFAKPLFKTEKAAKRQAINWQRYHNTIGKYRKKRKKRRR